MNTHVEVRPDGCMAWILDLIGCAAYGTTEKQALAKLPKGVAFYLDWVQSYGDSSSCLVRVRKETSFVVVERIHGDELVFEADRLPATSDDINRTITLLQWAREELRLLMAQIPEAALDWVPPYKIYPEWAHWRSIREVLVHVALCEVRYYLQWIGHNPGPLPTPNNLPPDSRQWYRAVGDDWKGLLTNTRAQTVAFLRMLTTTSDRARIVEKPEGWSVRKVLRRLVWHEIVHTKNIGRILRDFRAMR